MPEVRRKALDKGYEDKLLKDLLDGSPAALAAVTDSDVEALEEAAQHQDRPAAPASPHSNCLCRMGFRRHYRELATAMAESDGPR